MANSHSKNNLVEDCGSSDVNSKYVYDEQINIDSVSFSDFCSLKKSAVPNINNEKNVITKYTKLKQSNSTVTYNTNTPCRYKKHGMNALRTSHHNQTIKIFHQNIRRLRNKTNELVCCIQDDSPHILCLTEHHLQYKELALLHIENYILGAHYCRNTKHMGGVCMFLQNNIPFTCLEIGNYCKDQDIEMCGIQLNHEYDKLCILAVYRSPSGNFDNFFN